MTRVLRAAERFRSAFGGVESWHCFSAGGHYDPDNIAFGALVGCDEHLLAAGAGFDWHQHAGVTIVSWVLAGALRHEDGDGVRIVTPGEELVQATGPGMRHRETNASSDRPLRFVQFTLVGDPAVRLQAWHDPATTPSGQWHLFVAAGAWQVDEAEVRPGDSVRGTGETVVTGAGQLLALSW